MSDDATWAVICFYSFSHTIIVQVGSPLRRKKCNSTSNVTLALGQAAAEGVRGMGGEAKTERCHQGNGRVYDILFITTLSNNRKRKTADLLGEGLSCKHSLCSLRYSLLYSLLQLWPIITAFLKFPIKILTALGLATYWNATVSGWVNSTDLYLPVLFSFLPVYGIWGLVHSKLWFLCRIEE